MSEEMRKYKVVLLGDAAVGKTSLVLRYVRSQFDEKYLKTLGTNVYKKEIIEEVDGEQVKSVLQVWDIMGQRAFPSVIKSSLKGANGVIFVCDLTNMNSLGNLDRWLRLAFNTPDDSCFVFLANKSDLPDAEFGFFAVKSVADMFQSPFYVTSAKTGDGVEEAFLRIASLVANKKYVPKDLKFSIEKVVEDYPDILKVEDNIINTYCNMMGGYQETMPSVQKEFEKRGIDFENPTKEQLEDLAECFMNKAKMKLSGIELKVFQNNLERCLKDLE